MVQMTLQECKTHESASHSIQTAVDSIEMYLSNIRNTNSFMLMTINRCLDYAKASKGLRLVPKNETIDLWEAVQLPLNCMCSMQSRIAIHMHPIPDSVCTHVITDKQWLQENLLCLLSNAVKYSQEGRVDVTVGVENFCVQSLAMLCGGQSDDCSFSSGASSAFLSSNSLARQASVLPVNDGGDVPVGKSDGLMKPFLRVEVEDTGNGLTDDAMMSLFNPFKQSQRLAGGTGLGLYSLAKRVESLKGFYGVTKRKDGRQGSLFWFAIPYNPDRVFAEHVLKCRASFLCDDSNTIDFVPQSSMAAALRAVRSSSASLRRSGETPARSLPTTGLSVLLVDDSPAIVKMSGLMLKRMGHDVSTADNGAVAVKMVQERWQSTQTKYDVVLMDLQMPVMDGLEATRRIRQLEESGVVGGVGGVDSSGVGGRAQVIVGMSANSDHETAQCALEAGVDTFLAKPFNVDSISVVFASVT